MPCGYEVSFSAYAGYKFSCFLKKLKRFQKMCKHFLNSLFIIIQLHSKYILYLSKVKDSVESFE